MQFLIDPVAFSIGPVSVRWYGLIMAAAFSIGIYLAYKRAKSVGIDPEHIINMVLFIIPSAIIGARIYYVVFEWHRYADNPWSVFYVWHGGLAIHGGLIGGVLAAYIYIRVKKLKASQIADICAPSVVLGEAIGRWGNFINQEAHGGPVSEEFISKFPQFIADQMYISGQYYHPTFLYQSVWNLCVFVFLCIYWRKKKFDGEIALWYLSLYSLGRFFIEDMRMDSLMLGGFQVAQVVSVVLIIVSLSIIIYRRVLLR